MVLYTNPKNKQIKSRVVAGATLSTFLLTCGVVSFAPAAMAATAPSGLGTAETYSVLSGQAVTNTGPTVLGGNLGVNPGEAVTGFPPGEVQGVINAGNAESGQAQSDLVIAYNDLAGREATESVSADLGGQTFVDGVYNSAGPLALTGTVTLDGQGDPDSVFIFQAGSTLTTASSSNVNLINGAQACNVYWQVGSSATLGTDSTFVGSILALTSITATTGTDVEGRALARNGSVTLDDNTFTEAICDDPEEEPTDPDPTDDPTDEPTDPDPTDEPTEEPTEGPTPPVTEEPTETPTDEPTDSETPPVTDEPTDSETPPVTDEPTDSETPPNTDTPDEPTTPTDDSSVPPTVDTPDEPEAPTDEPTDSSVPPNTDTPDEPEVPNEPEAPTDEPTDSSVPPTTNTPRDSSVPPLRDTPNDSSTPREGIVTGDRNEIEVDDEEGEPTTILAGYASDNMNPAGLTGMGLGILVVAAGAATVALRNRKLSEVGNDS